VVLTFVDITERRQVEEALRESERQLRQQKRLVELSRDPIIVWDFDGGIIEWNRGSEELYGYSRAEALGKPKDQLLGTATADGGLDKLKVGLLEQGGFSGELRHRAKDGRVLAVESRLQLESVDGRRLVLEFGRAKGA
jgi:two-component system CheB/CheR fusion protein